MAQTHSLDLESSSSQYASISDASQTGLDLSGSFSFEAWVKIESTFSGTTRYILGKAANPYPSARSYGFGVAESGGVYKLSLIHSNGSTQEFQQSDAWTFGLGTWYHLAVSFDAAGDVKFYVNGAQHGAAKASALTSTAGNSADFVIGNTPYLIGVEGYWDGLLKDVRVFSDVRTQTEIAADARTQSVTDANLEGEWNLNNSYADSSGNGNTLTASGSPVFSTDIPWEGASVVSGSTYLETNLVSYWELEETSGTRVDSKGSNDLADNNTVLSGTGIQGNAADFETDNSEKLTLADASQIGLEPSGSYSISLWVNPETLPSSGNLRTLLGKFNGATTGSYGVSLLNNSGTTVIDFDSRQSSSEAAELVGQTSLSTSTWYHVVCVFNSTVNMSIFINGVLDATQTTTRTAPANTALDFTIGADSAGGRYHDGLIDEVAFYSRALHYGDVLDLYNNGSGIPYEASVSTGSNDTVTVTEDVTNRVTSLIGVSDAVTVTEGVELGITSFVDVSDVITVDEGVELVIASFVDVSDAITVDESVDLQQADGTSASDVVTVTESVEVFITELFLSVSDDVVIDESVSVSFDVSISVTDSVTVAENVEQILTSFTDVSDDITVDESAEMFITELHLSVSDDVAIDEALDFMFETYLMVYEEITVDEDVTVTSSPDIYDEITVEEDVSIAILVTLDVYDEVAVSESTERLILSFISVSDDVTLTEGDFDSDSVIFGPQIPGKRPRGNAYFNNQQVSYGGSVG